MSNAQCFYPNGNPSLEDDIPCGPGSAVGCCPLNWACEANGLCYLQNEDYYGRYTCTDKDWGPGCPDICTYNNTAKGNEAVLECTAGSYCCDTNRPELSGGIDCCDASPSRFSIDGNAEVSSTPESPVQSSSSVPVSAPATLIIAQTSTTASAAASSTICDGVFGEALCGSICCATWQYCVYPGQCAASSVTVESSSGTLTSESPVNAGTTSSTSSIPIATEHTPTTSSSQLVSLHLTSLATPIVTSSPTLRTNGSIAVTNTTTAAVTPTKAPFPSVVHSKKFKIGVSVGVVVFAVFLILLALICWRRRHRTTQPKPPQLHPADPTTNGVPKPPVPNPYAQPFPTDPPPVDETGPANTLSRSHISLVPDHDRGNPRPSPNLRHAPALNPYSVQGPSAAAAGAALGDQEEHWRNGSPAPSYMTEDPAVRAPTPRSRQHLPMQREPGIQEAPGH